MTKLAVVQQGLATKGKLGPLASLWPTTAATTLRKDQEPALVIYRPCAETKEQLLLDDCGQRLLRQPPRLQEAGEVTACPQLGDMQLHRPGPGPSREAVLEGIKEFLTVAGGRKCELLQILEMPG